MTTIVDTHVHVVARDRDRYPIAPGVGVHAWYDQQPADASINLWQAMVHQSVFLGEAADFQVKIGDRILLARTHPSLRTPIGQPVWARIAADKSVAMPAVAGSKASP